MTHVLLSRITKLFKYKGLYVYIPEGVFNPTFTLSTSLIIDYLNEFKPKGKVLEIGCGTGAISIYIAKKFGLKSYCTDISEVALATAKINSKINGVEKNIEVLKTEKLRYVASFDLVITNPPYLPLEPIDSLDLNWCGGRDLNLLKEAILLGRKALRKKGEMIITLSSLTDLTLLDDFLKKQGFFMVGIKRRVSPFDLVFLYHLKLQI
ncbi:MULTISPECIES: methyltransferase [Fervidicoccus]|uniref:Methyltransferase small n=1 Tax=Fervidicoccus fontis (strain DSM 19380 / JCM 18336 / VKM B-2539 / Kam940) TaxID=1163730 RepID=I0A2A5_FERFK|nr:class I SAM-dependent methyltransferase [Fervidicoccus fontis]AFH43112.1 methyltransferase small [Fervidicoccus fontis Kam940]